MPALISALKTVSFNKFCRQRKYLTILNIIHKYVTEHKKNIYCVHVINLKCTLLVMLLS